MPWAPYTRKIKIESGVLHYSKHPCKAQKRIPFASVESVSTVLSILDEPSVTGSRVRAVLVFRVLVQELRAYFGIRV